MIKVEIAGMFSTIQDEGRWGYQAYGMPVAGAMDRYAYRVANIMAGNRPGAAAVEMTVTGDTLRFETDAYVAICGADLQPTLNGVKIEAWTAFPVAAGSVLACGYAGSGCRAYIAVRGGIDVPLVMGSRSTYTRAGVGGLGGRKLMAGDTLAIGEATPAPCQPLTLPAAYKPTYSGDINLRVLPGPQDDMFPAAELATLFAGSYTVTEESDRMGCRLEGLRITHAGKADIISDALPLGAIQIPGHGQPIVMLADRQTTGGYTKIGTVIGPDLSLLVQAKPGDTVRFRSCSDDEAVAALRQERDTYAAISCWRDGSLPPPIPARRLSLTIDGKTYAVEIEEV